jgi:Cu/Ag efflux pump CusA
VDDARIDVENIAGACDRTAWPTRHAAGAGRARASLEVRRSVVYATFVVALVFVGAR